MGRSIRSIVNLKDLGHRTIWLDCDVIQADGGTRTAAITGAYVALHQAVQYLMGEGKLKFSPLTGSVAAISCGVVMVNDKPQSVVDLDFHEDSSAIADANFVMDGQNRLVEVQVTGEKEPFTPEQFNEMLALAQSATAELTRLQQKVLQG